MRGFAQPTASDNGAFPRNLESDTEELVQGTAKYDDLTVTRQSLGN